MPLAQVKPAAAQRGTVEQTYQKLTQREHILQRPDTYVGSVEAVTQDGWVFDAAAGRMAQRKLTYVPGLYKIFDEILVNAADNKQRDTSMSEIRVEIDAAAGRISVQNNGKGVPVVMHQEHGIYVPELIFGHLLTSSNYNDNQKKVTGGRNGYGAKLANIFSSEFVVETSDSAEGKRFKMKWSDNMTAQSKPEIKAAAKEDFTKISWVPDLAKFGMSAMDEDIVALMERRAYDMAGCTHSSVKVYLNGKKLPVADFKSYVDLFLGPKQAADAVPRVFEKVGDRWEVAVAASEDGFAQVSFVNSIATSKGGTHVNHVADQVLKPNHVKGHLRVFINCLIENPAFDSQTKENMTLKQSAFGSKCQPSDKFFKDALNCGVLESILSFAQSKQSKDLKKTDGTKKSRLTGIPKLDDANEAGGRNGSKCTLIITEGDSAKALAVAGLSIVGRATACKGCARHPHTGCRTVDRRDHYGVFPLRGKLLNVRDAAHSTIMANKEISELKQILGLQQGKSYDDEASLKSLRYGERRGGDLAAPHPFRAPLTPCPPCAGKLMIMTDQDHDGSHIKGLVINFLHCYWPALLQKRAAPARFVTPIVKASKGRQAIAFFTLKEYENWREEQGAAASGWQIKYYKGLGTSSAAEAKAYFSDLDLHELSFKWTGDADREGIVRAFSKSMADARKEWLRGYDADAYVDHSQSHLTYHDFVDRELIHFSNADNMRSIPSFEVKVAQLAGYAYHHGEASLGGTIVGMAQTFVGSNNIALLHGAGQFGTRLMGGKDAASPRYIFCKLPQLTRLIFHPHDDALLEYLEDDGQRIEPRYYMPILPMVLVNGADGIGTGWSSSVPNFNPRDIVANLRRLMAGEEPEPMTPWYRGFAGTVTPADQKGSYSTYGSIAKADERTLRISELPVRKWTQDYKETVLEPMMSDRADGAAKSAELAGALAELRENHTDTTVSFTLKFASDAAAAAANKVGLHKALKLSSSISTSNMTLFDAQGRIQKYEAVEAVLRDFYALRLSFYEKRKLHLQDKLTGEWSKLDNRMRFVLAVISGELKIANRKKADLVAELAQKGYAPFEPAPKRAAAGDDGEEEAAGEAEGGASASARGYDYLLSMPLWSLTRERVEQLRGECTAKEAELQTLLATSPRQLWAADLDAFEAGLAEWEAALEAPAEGAAAKARKGGAKGGRKKKAYDSDVAPPAAPLVQKERKAAAASHGTNWSAMIEDAQPDKPARKLGAAKPAASKPAAAKRPAKKAAAVADSDEESDCDLCKL
ncbi:hypothetical protein EMIHUDRAFT_458166 [Emiliania huxleyi CCMP1516]|uniref:DNA topoisomerase 2 n=2 Tax=Emiliania huxleyi TaxID=2903 RepID=A0A0D3JG34_EMIH1|nr:hypothetical protein EMIHUDRAFT_458166 [Emiliania huxleyi CCMP1516]EOD22469.1 hypothetical protein EMIHUDRAFT_458166 [Emiliania huxleyi CCMP1516]|eukprot:XP_005774898.1 hypothetical protein EMIHUDRAFT_458166 [Emiliania huxleyi CCMP1516]